MFAAKNVRRHLALMVVSLFIAWATSPLAQRDAAQAEEHAKSEKKSGSKKKKSKEEASTKSPEDRLAEDKAKYQITNNYVQNWISLKPISGARVESPTNTAVYQPTSGEATVVIFLASWCLPCQHIITDLLKLEKDFNTKNTKFIYVFTQDEAQDALGFVKTYGMDEKDLSGEHLLGTDEIQREFHYPLLPSYYVADRHGWLCMRSLQMTKRDIDDIRNFLDLQTSF